MKDLKSSVTMYTIQYIPCIYSSLQAFEKPSPPQKPLPADPLGRSVRVMRNPSAVRLPAPIPTPGAPRPAPPHPQPCRYKHTQAQTSQIRSFLQSGGFYVPMKQVRNDGIDFFYFLYDHRICRPPPKQPPTLPKPHFTAGVKFSSWEPDRRDFVPGDTRFLHYEPLRDTSCVRVLMWGVTFDPRGALPLNGAMSPSSGTCHALFMSVTSVFIWAQCTVVDTFSIVAIGGSPTFTWCSFCCCCYCCCFDLFRLCTSREKRRRVISVNMNHIMWTLNWTETRFKWKHELGVALR